MGIHGLTKLIAEHAPEAIKSHSIDSYFGRKVAIDASMSIYQFMIAVRQQDGNMLMNDQGETTRYSSNDSSIYHMTDDSFKSSYGHVLSNSEDGGQRHKTSICF